MPNAQPNPQAKMHSKMHFKMSKESQPTTQAKQCISEYAKNAILRGEMPYRCQKQIFHLCIWHGMGVCSRIYLAFVHSANMHFKMHFKMHFQKAQEEIRQDQKQN